MPSIRKSRNPWHDRFELSVREKLSFDGRERIGKLVRFVGSDLLAYQRERGGSEVRVLGE